MKNIFQDSEGDISSKRISGVICLSIAAIMGVGLYFASIFAKVNDPTTAMNVINGFLLSGSSLLGIGVLEGKFTK